MQTIIAISQHGSLTAAAAVLDTSLPTVVRVLAKVEKKLQTRLFERTTRKLVLTEEGKIYLEYCKRILSEVDEVENLLLDRKSEPQGTIVITAPKMFGLKYVSPLVNDFLCLNKKVDVKLLLIDRVIDLVEEGIDVAVRIGPVSRTDLVVTQLGTLLKKLYASPNVLQRYEELISKQKFEALPFVQQLGLMPSTNLNIECETDHIELKLKNIRLVTNQADAALEACLKDIGIGMFLSYQVEEQVNNGELIALDLPYTPKQTPVSFIYTPSRRLSGRTMAFINWSRPKLQSILKNQKI
jgi:DNA-binding transcriptional LysR family regulator